MFDLSDTLENTEASEQGQYFQKDEIGEFLLEVELIEVAAPSRKCREGGVRCRFRVLEGNNPKVAPGTIRDINQWKHLEGFEGRVTRFFAALLPDLDKAGLAKVGRALQSAEVREKLGWPENFLKGERVCVSAFLGPTKGTGLEIVKTNFRPAPAQ